MRLTLVSAPSGEPLSVEEAKTELSIDFSDHDTLIDGLISAARESFERETRRQLLTATWRGFLDRFPRFDREPIEVAMPPLQSVTSVTYVDTAGVTQTWAAAEYDVQTFSGPFARRGTISPKPDQEYPLTRRVPNAVVIEFVAGHGANPEDVPEEIRRSLLAWIGHHYEKRGGIVVQGQAGVVPEMAFNPWREWSFG